MFRTLFGFHLIFLLFLKSLFYKGQMPKKNLWVGKIHSVDYIKCTIFEGAEMECLIIFYNANERNENY